MTIGENNGRGLEPTPDEIYYNMEIGETFGFVMVKGQKYRKWKPSWPGKAFAYTRVDSFDADILKPLDNMGGSDVVYTSDTSITPDEIEDERMY